MGGAASPNGAAAAAADPASVAPRREEESRFQRALPGFVSAPKFELILLQVSFIYSPCLELGRPVTPATHAVAQN